jgi:hypothetical protein
MSGLNVEQVLTESVESQPEPVGVSVSEISHNSRLGAYSKPQNDHSFSNMSHQPKAVSEVHQNKDSQPMPGTDCLPLVSNASPGQPSEERGIPAAAQPHGSQQDLTHGGVTQPARSHQSPLSGTESAPAISVVPSSPLTPGGPANPMVSSEVHRSLEPSPMSAADRRASRRRSAMDVRNILFFNNHQLLRSLPSVFCKSSVIWVLFQSSPFTRTRGSLKHSSKYPPEFHLRQVSLSFTGIGFECPQFSPSEATRAPPSLV